MKNIARYLLLPLLLLAVGLWLYLPHLNTLPANGTAALPGLRAEARICRDEQGVPYIYAASLEDALRAQGYAVAQDRLFQMQLTRLFAEGRIAELAGAQAIGLDTRMRTFGFFRQAGRQVALLEPSELALLQAFTDGVNAYIASGESLPVEFKLAGIAPEPFTPQTCVAILYYMGWGAAANYTTEMLGQLLIDRLGWERFRQIYPVQHNPEHPDAGPGPLPAFPDSAISREGLALLGAPEAFPALPLALGSNNWAVGPGKSASGKPMLANDPHLDARILPGTLYACGIFTPEVRAVGVTVPGIPGILIGRNEHVANGLTNAYLDAQDLYIETVNPADTTTYLEGTVVRSFEVLRETLRVRDEQAPGGLREVPIEIRHTRRGPVVSKVLPGMQSDRTITLRWSAYETMGTRLGITHLLQAKSVQEARGILSHATAAFNNVTLADAAGHIGWQTIGRVPKRAPGQGMLPHAVVDTTDNWLGFIPFDSMPQLFDPEKGWVGNANQNTLPAGYPYYISNQFASNYRYARLCERMQEQAVWTAEDHWQLQRDCHNVMARRWAPWFAKVLGDDTRTALLGQLLEGWDAQETEGSVAATVYQYVYRNFARQVLADELGDLAPVYLDEWYLWQERLELMVAEGNSPWFDRMDTPDKRETAQDNLLEAGLAALEELKANFGDDHMQWEWGKVHTIRFVNPLVREGWAAGLVGGQTWPAAGSGETLYRARHSFEDPTEVGFGAAMRMVVDLGQDDYVMAVLSGGQQARTFSPRQSDQLPDFFGGGVRYWWYSEAQIKAHTQGVWVLQPE